MNSNIKNKLTNLFKLNKKNWRHKNKNLIILISNINLIKNVYFKLKNRKKVSNKLINKIDLKILKTLRIQIKTNNYKWNNNKFLKSKRIFSLKDRIVQKLLEIVLHIIYEPVFKTLKYNYGFKNKKNAQMAIKYLKLQSIKWIYAFKSKITEKKFLKHHGQLTQIIKKKIIDPIFLQLIENLYNTKTHNYFLYNIYIHEFDLYISKKIRSLERKKILVNYKNFKRYYRFLYKIYFIKQKILQWKIKLKKYQKFNALIFQKAKDFKKRNKKKQMKLKVQKKRKKLTKIIYNRYSNNWIMFTNYNFYKIKKLKEKLIQWFKKILKINLNKILIINLFKNKLNYLGFTFSIIPPKIKRIVYKNNIKAKIKFWLILFVGIDHGRLTILFYSRLCFLFHIITLKSKFYCNEEISNNSFISI